MSMCSAYYGIRDPYLVWRELLFSIFLLGLLALEDQMVGGQVQSPGFRLAMMEYGNIFNLMKRRVNQM